MRVFQRVAVCAAILTLSGCSDINAPDRINSDSLTSDPLFQVIPTEVALRAFISGTDLPRTKIHGIADTPISIDMDQGQAQEFCWHVVGRLHGMEFRYGWDILDVNDDEQWAAAWTDSQRKMCAPTRTFFFGTHVFNLELRDGNGNITRASIRINVLQDADRSSDVTPAE